MENTFRRRTIDAADISQKERIPTRRQPKPDLMTGFTNNAGRSRKVTRTPEVGPLTALTLDPVQASRPCLSDHQHHGGAADVDEDYERWPAASAEITSGAMTQQIGAAGVKSDGSNSNRFSAGRRFARGRSGAGNHRRRLLPSCRQSCQYGRNFVTQGATADPSTDRWRHWSNAVHSISGFGPGRWPELPCRRNRSGSPTVARLDCRY